MDQFRLTTLLKQYYGYSEFRPKQLDIINNIIEARNCIALLPTGGGKSLCYQLPCIYLNSKCLVISPLIALMEDQVDSLKRRSIPGLSIHSGMEKTEMYKHLNRFYHSSFGILYVSPERLGNEDFRAYISKIKLSHIAIDEAHCISQWGHDFRPSYLNISKFIGSLKHRPQITALTATATINTLRDIKEFAGIANPNIIRKGFYRDNINIKIQLTEAPISRLHEQMKKLPGESEIIYSRSRKGVKILAEKLKAIGSKSLYYHGNLPFLQRKSISEKWRNGEVTTIVATNAFGMGIDKSNVRKVIHFDIPPSIEEYYQEIGRAGRDGLSSEAIMILDKDAIKEARDQMLKGIISRSEWDRFMTGILDLFDTKKVDTLYPLIIRRIAHDLNLHPFQVVRCLQLCEKAGILYVSNGVLEPSRVMAISSKVKNEVFHQKRALKYLITDYLLKSYEYLFDSHIVIIEEQIADALSIETIQVEGSLLELEQEGIISYQKRKTKPFIRINREFSTDFQIENILKIQDTTLLKLDKMIDYIQSKECRMQVLMRYFDEKCVPCGECDNCNEQSENEDGYTSFINKLKTLPHNSLNISQEMHGLNSNTKAKIISKLKVLENEELIKIENGIITSVIPDKIVL